MQLSGKETVQNQYFLMERCPFQAGLLYFVFIWGKLAKKEAAK